MIRLQKLGRLHSVQPYLKTDQIEKLVKDGFHFGAHSIDHPEYRFLPFEEQIRQTSESINYVRSKFSLNYGLFSFPFTDYEVSDRFFQTIAESKIVDLSFGNAGLKRDSHPAHFQHIVFERGKLNAGNLQDRTDLLHPAKSSRHKRCAQNINLIICYRPLSTP